MAELNLAELEKLLTVKQVAELFGVRAGLVRKAVKEGTIPGVHKVLGKTGFDPEAVLEWKPPTPGTRSVGAKREDGRQRYAIYLTAEEHKALVGQGFEIKDPRDAARARRAERKAAKGAASKESQAEAPEVTEGNPFEDFGA